MVVGSTLDFIFIGVFAVLLIIGLRVGLINMLAAVAVVVSSYFSVTLFGDDLVELIMDSVTLDENIIRILTYVAIVLAAVAVFGIAAKLVRRTLKFAWLGWIDLTGGAAIGIVASLVVFSLVSGVSVWIFDLGNTAVTALSAPEVVAVGGEPPSVLVGFTDWLKAQLNGSFITTNLGIPLWDAVSWILPSEFLGVELNDITTAIERESFKD